METIQLIFTDVPLGLGIGITSLLLGLGYMSAELVDKVIEKRVRKQLNK